MGMDRRSGAGLRVIEAAGVTGRPLSMTTFSPKARLPGVGLRGSSNTTGKPFDRKWPG
jgi:hypothetical protein